VRTLKLALALCLSVALFACNRSEKDRLTVGTLPGGVSATSLGNVILLKGGQGNFPPTPRHTSSFIASGPQSGQLTISEIEITVDGNQWVPLISEPIVLTISSSYGPLLSINSQTKKVPQGEYHGIRIRLPENALSVTSTFDGANPSTITLNPYATYDTQTVLDNPQGPGPVIQLTTANKAVAPFTIRSSDITYIMVGIRTQSDNPPAWGLGVTAVVTKIAPQ